jgi:hypothetical protein
MDNRQILQLIHNRLAISFAEGSKKCDKGKSCSSTCIFKGDDCITELGPEVSKALTELSNRLQKRVEEGSITEEQSVGALKRLTQKGDDESVALTEKRAKEISAALKKLSDEEANAVIDTIIPGVFTERTKNTPATPEEIEGLNKNREQLKKYSDLQKEVLAAKAAGKEMTPEQLRDKLAEISPPRKKVSDAQVELAMALMPEQERAYLKSAGALNEKETGGRFGDVSKSDALPASYGPLREQTTQEAENRAKLLTRVYLETGGKDVYTGKPLPITKADLEHIIAESAGGKAAEQGRNYGFLLTSMNVGRGSKLQEDWVNTRLKGLEFDKNGKLTEESRAKVQKEVDKGAASGALKASVVSSAKLAKSAPQVNELLDKIKAVPDQKVQAKLYNKFVSTFLSEQGVGKVAETARAGLQSHLRAEAAHYWYGDKMPGGLEAGRTISNKIQKLMDKGDTEGVKKLATIMQGASGRIKTYVNSNVKPDPNVLVKGVPVLATGGAKTQEIAKAIGQVREQILSEIEAI